MTYMKQGQQIIVKLDCRLIPEKGRAWALKPGQKFWVTSPDYNNAANNYCYVAREGRPIYDSIKMTKEQISEVFHAI